MDKGPWSATVYGVTKTLSELHTKLGVEQPQLYLYYKVMKILKQADLKPSNTII